MIRTDSAGVGRWPCPEASGPRTLGKRAHHSHRARGPVKPDLGPDADCSSKTDKPLRGKGRESSTPASIIASQAFRVRRQVGSAARPLEEQDESDHRWYRAAGAPQRSPRGSATGA